jgi:hypothetical protein
LQPIPVLQVHHAGLEGRASSALTLALASVGEGPEDGAGVLVHDLTKVHGDGEQEDQEKKVDPKERMQKFSQGFWWKHVKVHPDKGDDGENGEHADDDSGGALGSVGGLQGPLDKGYF